ncbi:hypothetical protein Tco_0841539 [Tanacetum coccineum]|uniref:Uncharacterized protein n=1 Tax=Tanacetum coccineum TaxID=301880 RepID=A0ABQ5B055_9ASTR
MINFERNWAKVRFIAMKKNRKTGTENGEESDLQNEISFLATDNGSLEQGSEDGLMQEDTELTKVGGSFADEPVIDSNDKWFAEVLAVLKGFN